MSNIDDSNSIADRLAMISVYVATRRFGDAGCLSYTWRDRRHMTKLHSLLLYSCSKMERLVVRVLQEDKHHCDLFKQHIVQALLGPKFDNCWELQSFVGWPYGRDMDATGRRAG
jgi:hypothetical protein